MGGWLCGCACLKEWREGVKRGREVNKLFWKNVFWFSRVYTGNTGIHIGIPMGRVCDRLVGFERFDYKCAK